VPFVRFFKTFGDFAAAISVLFLSHRQQQFESCFLIPQAAAFSRFTYAAAFSMLQAAAFSIPQAAAFSIPQAAAVWHSFFNFDFPTCPISNSHSFRLITRFVLSKLRVFQLSESQSHAQYA